MKVFHTSINIKGVHIINYFNWEEKLDKLYRKVINPSNLCYGIVSNSERISKTDQYGKLSDGLTYRFHNKIDTLSHANMTQLSGSNLIEFLKFMIHKVMKKNVIFII